MFEEYQICPYTGLRSFTEEESLYFKGREEHIEQATEQLQRNKFLMLTGASGDGKSSLVYAGIIPNARAGFLKSKYSQWGVADFRPERTPFKNLCRALARQLEIANPQTVESELQHGFSALVDLYKNSKCFIDVDSAAWLNAGDADRAVLKRSAANLIIIVDQFEEFFTNPENYHNGIPSPEANLVLNLLLETSRIALEENLPIYIVFTMRSDYIGQCAAFRSLPEYIGFSQFFVPRLNRTQLQQVIEEPAILSGNRISRRLTERLIHDIAEGVDQLPILQHALNQIWHAADAGKEEMDLIHYAMVGGMSVRELPDEFTGRFQQWFEGLSPEIKACYHEPNLQNVLDTHTNKLYEGAAAYYKQKTGKNIPDQDAKFIVKTAFICLTKIDQSRAVRNRMTLQEITNIVGRAEWGTTEVGTVLNIFREPGNTFIRPFILEDTESQHLQPEDILDITHESLIRNWEYLEQWAKEEFTNYTISLDFEQQLNRWVDSGKSGGFLLSIGPLTYFEDWYNTVKPNVHWIARYLPDELVHQNKLNRARLLLTNAQDFLKSSAQKHAITRTVMRYGMKRIAAVIGGIALLTLSSFAVRDYFRTQNDFVLSAIQEQSLTLAKEPKLSLEFMVPVITEQLILGSLTIPDVLEAIPDTHQRIKIATGIATQLVNQGHNEPKAEIIQALTSADSLLVLVQPTQNPQELSSTLKLFYDYSVTAGFAQHYNADQKIQTLVKQQAQRSAQWALQIFKEQPNGFSNIQLLSLALENGINHAIFSEEELSELLHILSPFENANRSSWLLNNYSRDRVLIRGSQTYGFTYNGLYQELAYLYAAAGNSEKALQCVDSVLHYQGNFYQSDYTTHAENATNIAAVFFAFGQVEALDAFVRGYCERKKVTPVDFYSRLVARTVTDYSVMEHTNFYKGAGGQVFSNLNLKFADEKLLKFFYQKLKMEISALKDADERNFNLAMAAKNEGNMLFHQKEIRGVEILPTDNDHYAQALEFYRLVSEDYRNQSVNVVGNSGTDLVTVPRKFLFIFPDFRVPFHPFEPRNLLQFYNSSSFIQFILDQQYFDALYETATDRSYFELWLKDYHLMMSSRDWLARDPMPDTLLQQLAVKLEPYRNALDLTILYLHLSENAFRSQNSESGIAYLEKINLNGLLNAFQYKNFDFGNSYSLELTGKAIANLAVHKRMDLAYRFVRVFKKQVNRSNLYAFASQQVSLRKESPDVAKQLLDSARVEMNRLDNPAEFQPNRHNVAIALMYLDPVLNSEEAYRTIKNSFGKFEAIWRFSRAHAFAGNLYQARQLAPPLISIGDQSVFLALTLEGYTAARGIPDNWKKFKQNDFVFARQFLPYIPE